MSEHLDALRAEYKELTRKLSDPNELLNPERIALWRRRHDQLHTLLGVHDALDDVNRRITETELLLTGQYDSEWQALVEEELKQFQIEHDRLEAQLQELSQAKDPDDDRNCIIEIRGAAGGAEANIFAGNLYRMYTKYAEIRGYQVELLESSESPTGGFAHISFLLKGPGAYGQLKYESGSHRVQRVPETESQGRIHTSTATVLVMPEADQSVEIDMAPEELKIDVFRSGGAGGQSVNTTDSAVRITHLPTKTVVTCQDGRSQHENKEKALRVLKTKLYEREIERQHQEEGRVRKSKLGSGDRSEKIRTYNFPQNRIKDHRIDFNVQQLDRVLDGRLQPLLDALHKVAREEASF